jgi:hypothetical protein
VTNNLARLKMRPVGFEPTTKGFKLARRFPTGLDYLTL